MRSCLNGWHRLSFQKTLIIIVISNIKNKFQVKMGEEIVRSYKKQRELAGCLLGCMYDYV
jgi:hypothetical protein